MAKTATYSLISSQTLSSSQSTVTFSSIPQTFTDLVIVSNVLPTSSPFIAIRLNSDTGTNYSRTSLSGSGTSALSARASNETYGYVTPAAILGVSNGMINLQDYSNTTTFKTAISRWSDASNVVATMATLWRSTSAITAVEINTGGVSTFASGSNFKLYGIEAYK